MKNSCFEMKLFQLISNWTGMNRRLFQKRENKEKKNVEINSFRNFSTRRDFNPLQSKDLKNCVLRYRLTVDPMGN